MLQLQLKALYIRGVMRPDDDNFYQTTNVIFSLLPTESILLMQIA